MDLSPKSPLKSTPDNVFSVETLNRLLLEKEDIIGKKSEVIQSQKARIAALEEQLKLNKIKQYGRSSEQQSDQLGMFNEVEDLADDNPEPSMADTDAPDRKKPGGRKGLNPNIPRVQQRHALSDDEKVGAIDSFFVKVKEELDIIPAKVQVIEILQEKAVFQDDHNERKIISAPLPLHPLGKAEASINTLAYVIIAKYLDSLPLYRLEKILARYGGSVTCTTLANWLIRLSDQLIPLINLMREQQWQGNVIQADDKFIWNEFEQLQLAA